MPPPAQQQRFRERQVLDPNTQEWIDQAPSTQAAPTDPVDQARAALAEDHPAQAAALLRKWQKGRGDDERYYESVFLLGESYFESKDFWKALKQYQIVADNASGELFDAANRRCVDVARALSFRAEAHRLGLPCACPPTPKGSIFSIASGSAALGRGSASSR